MSRICQIPERLRRRVLRSASLLLLSTLTLLPAVLLAQEATGGEQRAVRAFEAAKSDKAGALALEAFLAKMPKGADLHMHLSGAVYAETFLKDAAADKLCVNPKTLSFAKNAGLEQGPPASPICADGDVPAASVFQNQKLYDALVDAFSMRGFVPSAGVSGHDQFFATFDRFGGLDKSHAGEWLDEVATRAAAQNEQYLEVMQTPSFFDLAPLWNTLGWPATPGGTAEGSAQNAEGDATGTSRAELDALRDKAACGRVARRGCAATRRSSTTRLPRANGSSTAASRMLRPPAR